MAYGFSIDELADFREALRRSMQPSVDALLEKRPEYMKVGKAAIAARLIPCEEEGVLRTRYEEMKWYEYLFNQMDAGRDEFAENQLSIITFNYDRSIEYSLLSALKNSYGMSDEEAADLLKASIPIVHVYGQLGRPHFWAADGRAYRPEVTNEAIDKCVSEINIMHEQSDESPEFHKARQMIEQADVLCFLGFGYHKTNLRRLGVKELFKGRMLLGSAYDIREAERTRVRGLISPADLLRPADLGPPDMPALEFLREYPVLVN